MSWLFWVLLVVLVIFGIQGFRKGLLRTVLSMVSTIAVIIITAWLTPNVGDYIRENTQWQEKIEQKMGETLLAELEEMEIPESSQMEFIDKLPLPDIMKELLIKNNTAEIYEQFDVNGFAEYLSAYLARGIVNGIAFIIAFIITLIIMRVILFAVNLVTELPLIGTLDALGGFAIGIVHGIFWIAILFLVVVLISDTKLGGMLMETINSDPMLSWVYDKNALVNIIMKVVS